MKYITQAEAVNKLELLIKAKYDGSQTEFSNDIGVTRQYINNVLKQKAVPSKKILEALGLKQVKLYESIRKSRNPD